MRLLLDAHVSGRVVGRTLREDGHDVVALDAAIELEGLADPEVLARAASEARILITANVRDFVPLLAERLAAGRSHAGCVLIPRGIRNEDFSTIIAGLRAVLEGTDMRQWSNRTVWLRR